jgi:hypothetical protein
VIVPLPRTLKKGMVGRDVLMVQRAASRAHLRKWGWHFNGHFGRGLERNLKRFQKAHGLKPDGVYGPDTHRKMARYYDAYSANVMVKLKKKLDKPVGKAGVVYYAMQLYNYRYHVHYSQGPMRMSIIRYRLRPPWRRELYEDCSSSSKGCYWLANLPTPDGLPYTMYEGYTGTLSVHGRRVSHPQPGDLGFYGYGWPYVHVVICIGYRDGVPLVMSHGKESDPAIHLYNYRWGFSHWRAYA